MHMAVVNVLWNVLTSARKATNAAAIEKDITKRDDLRD
jgi:hypothetical protein